MNLTSSWIRELLFQRFGFDRALCHDLDSLSSKIRRLDILLDLGRHARDRNLFVGIDLGTRKFF